MDHISIIIVNYNADNLTKDCLKSLRTIAGSNFKHQIIVVDNGSQEPLVLPKSVRSDKVDVIRSESNLGFTGGNNLGITYAIEKYNSEYICLLNNDTYVDSGFLRHLYDCLSQTVPGGMICPKVYFGTGHETHREYYPTSELGNVLWYGGGSIDWANLTAFHRGVDEIDRGHFDTEKHSDFCTGCCVLISREVLETIGLFDEQLFLYFEDTDLSVRAKNSGYQILFCPEAKIWHLNAGSSGGPGSAVHEYYQTRNRIYFGLKHGTSRIRLTTVAFAFRTLMTGNAPRRKAVLDIVMGNLGKEAYDRI